MATDRPSILSTIEQYSRRLFDFIRNRVRSNEDAEDILQEVWYQLSRLVDLDEIESISGWLYRVARNKIIDRYRKRSDLLYEDDLFAHEEGTMWRETLFGQTTSPDEELFQDLFWVELMKALDELPETQRETFVLNEMEGFTLREIAEKNHENIKTIISRKSYAVKHLRKRLRSLYDEL